MQSEKHDAWTGRTGFKHLRRAVKVIADGDASQDAMFLAEAAIQAPLDHPNVLRLVGVSMDQRPWLAVLELAEFGDVRSFLKTLKKSDFDLRAAEQVHLAAQVAYGLEYLHSERIVHRDIAARNILLASHSTAKIGDFGLARDYDRGEDSWLLTERECLSVQWAPVEVFVAGKKTFSQKTDVWSFGVFMWEVFTYGAMPYADIAAKRVPLALESNVRLQQPQDCPDAMYRLMASCWSKVPANRHTFHDLKEQLLAERTRITQSDGYQNVRDFCGIFKAQCGKEASKEREQKLPLQVKRLMHTATAPADSDRRHSTTSTNSTRCRAEFAEWLAHQEEEHSTSPTHSTSDTTSDTTPPTPPPAGRRSRISSVDSGHHGFEDDDTADTHSRRESIVFGFHNDIDNQHNHSARGGGDESQSSLCYGFERGNSWHSSRPSSITSIGSVGTDSSIGSINAPFAYERFTGERPEESIEFGFNATAPTSDGSQPRRRSRTLSQRDSPSSTPTRDMASVSLRAQAQAHAAVTWDAPDHYSSNETLNDEVFTSDDDGDGGGGGDDSTGVPTRARARRLSSSSITQSGTSSTSKLDGALRLGTCSCCANGLAPGDWYHHHTRNTGVCHRCYHLEHADQQDEFFWVSTTEDIIRALRPKLASPNRSATPPPYHQGRGVQGGLMLPSKDRGKRKTTSSTKRTKLSFFGGEAESRGSKVMPHHMLLSQPPTSGKMRMVANPFLGLAVK